MNPQLCEVINGDGSLLGYCSSAKARILIRKGKATFVDTEYKVIKLNYIKETDK